MINKNTQQSSFHEFHQQKGVGLIDVMIAVVVFSFGMLGLANLQVLSKQSNYEAIQRSTAAMLANDILERMRMNSVKDSTSTYNSSLANYVPTTSPVVLSYDDTLTTPTTDCTTSSCTYAQLASWDLYEFQQMLRGNNETDDGADVGGLLMPTACLSATVANGGPGAYTVAIVWRGQASIPLSSPPSNTCGAGVYDNASGDYAYRRIIEIKSYMSCSDPGGCA